MRFRAVSFVLLAFFLTAGIARADLYVNFKDGLKISSGSAAGCHKEGSTLRCTNNHEFQAKEGPVIQTQGYRGYVWAAFIPYGYYDNGYTERAMPSCQVSIWRQYLSATAEHRWHIEVKTGDPDRIKCWYYWHSNSNSANTVDIHAQKIK
jgi:hypothetical protein